VLAGITQIDLVATKLARLQLEVGAAPPAGCCSTNARLYRQQATPRPARLVVNRLLFGMPEQFNGKTFALATLATL